MIKYKEKDKASSESMINCKKKKKKKLHFLIVFLEKDVSCLYFRVLNTHAKVSHLFEAEYFHQLQFIPGYSASVSAGQKPGSDGKICKASFHPGDNSRAHLVQEIAEWHRPHICSSSRGMIAPGIQHYSCQYHLLWE